jgi:AcrR family transcriptional regulator
MELSSRARKTVTSARSGDGRLYRGAATRGRLLQVALAEFAARGYAGASTREICEAAGVNPASIHYHFTDKAGLYRAVIVEPLQSLFEPLEQMHAAMPPDPEGALRAVYEVMFAPMRVRDRDVMNLIRLHFRELAEPTGVLGDTAIRATAPMFHRVLAIVSSSVTGRADSDPPEDDDIRRLTFCLIGMAFDFYTTTEERRVFAPGLLEHPADVDRLIARLALYGAAMIDAERRRRLRSGTEEPAQPRPTQSLSQ